MSLKFDLDCKIKQCRLAKQISADSYQDFVDAVSLPFPDENTVHKLFTKCNADDSWYRICMVELTNFVLENASRIKIR